MLEERIDTLSNQVLQLISHFCRANTKSVEMAAPEDEVDGFLSPWQEKEQEEAAYSKRGNVHLPKFVLPQAFDGMILSPLLAHHGNANT